MPRIKPEDIKIEPGYWVYLNLKQSAVWKDRYSGISLDVWSGGVQQIPDNCDADDIRRIRRAVAFGRLFVSKDKPNDMNKAQESGHKTIYLREILTRSEARISEAIELLSNTDIEVLHNLELQKGSNARKGVLELLAKKIKSYASEFAAGVEGGGKEGIVDHFVRQPIKKGARPLIEEPPDVVLNKKNLRR